jgi:hypothetical protein
MKSKKTLLAIPLMAIAVIAIGFGMTSNVFAQSTASTTPAAVVDQPDGPNNVQVADNGTDNQKDGETADDHNSAKEGPNGDGDGEQKDQTELKK